MKLTKPFTEDEVKILLGTFASTACEEFLRLVQPSADSDARYFQKVQIVKAAHGLLIAGLVSQAQAGLAAERFPHDHTWLRWDDPLDPEGPPNPNNPDDVRCLPEMFGGRGGDLDDLQRAAASLALETLAKQMLDPPELFRSPAGHLWLTALWTFVSACSAAISTGLQRNYRVAKACGLFDEALAQARAARQRGTPKSHDPVELEDFGDVAAL